MKIFKLISGILILLVLTTGVIALLAMGGGLSFKEALLVVLDVFAGLAALAAFLSLAWLGVYLIDSALSEDKPSDGEKSEMNTSDIHP